MDATRPQERNANASERRPLASASPERTLSRENHGEKDTHGQPGPPLCMCACPNEAQPAHDRKDVAMHARGRRSVCHRIRPRHPSFAV